MRAIGFSPFLANPNRILFIANLAGLPSVASAARRREASLVHAAKLRTAAPVFAALRRGMPRGYTRPEDAVWLSAC